VSTDSNGQPGQKWSLVCIIFIYFDTMKSQFPLPRDDAPEKEDAYDSNTIQREELDTITWSIYSNTFVTGYGTSFSSNQIPHYPLMMR
jgi:hypothetical protein